MHQFHAFLYAYADYLSSTDIARIEITDGRVVMETRSHGIRMVCDAKDHRIAPIEILNFGAYEPAESRLLLGILRTLEDQGGMGTAFDVGANYGYYSLLLHKNFPALGIQAFEPLPPTFARLTENLDLNGAASVRANPFGLSDNDGEFPFYFYPEGSGNASAVDLSGLPSVQQLACRVRRMDDFTAASGLSPDFIKCDVEGAELMVFMGGRATLERCRPAVFTEMLRKWSAKFDYHPNEIITLFQGMGYGCFTAKEGRLRPFSTMDDTTIETNFFFLHDQKHRAALEAWSD
ncbi:MAG: FkbM family methyltransferase [Holophagaceae bacterium]|nr:FkbM family methyltransferase [Holophagaceae bacterium]